jgi:protein-S-isoprenylcysteine O-methyltransferase Ste14
MKRWMFFAYGVGCYLLFMAVYNYMIVFVGNLAPAVGADSLKTIDSGAGPLTAFAVAWNVALLGLFAVQHSVMARPAFKRAWTRIVPQEIERSTYVLASSLVTAIVMALWRPIDAVVWDVTNPYARAVAWTLFAVGWAMVPLVSLLINHFDLFGLRQVWLHLRRREYTSLPFHEPLLYSRVRHPLYIGWAIAFWATPTMTVGHLLFASVLTLYMVVAAMIEERDLVAHFGEVYEGYQRRVPMFLPRLRAVEEDRVGEAV